MNLYIQSIFTLYSLYIHSIKMKVNSYLTEQCKYFFAELESLAREHKYVGKLPPQITLDASIVSETNSTYSLLYNMLQLPKKIRSFHFTGDSASSVIALKVAKPHDTILRICVYDDITKIVENIHEETWIIGINGPNINKENMRAWNNK